MTSLIKLNKRVYKNKIIILLPTPKPTLNINYFVIA